MTDTAAPEVADEVLAYHLRELAIARSPDDPRRVLPTLSPTHRAVLDVGCGAGQTLLALELPAHVAGAGVDLNVAALALGRRLDTSGRLAFAAATGEALPFADASFDLVYCRVAIPYMHIDRAVTEMGRVLRPGGDLWLALHSWQLVVGELTDALRSRTPRAVLGHTYVLANGLLLHLTGRQFRRPFGARVQESYQTARSIRRALRAAGYEDVRVERVRRGDHLIATARRPRS